MPAVAPMTDVFHMPVAQRDVNVRAQFIARTYGHLFGAIALFTAIEWFLMSTPIGESVLGVVLGLPWMAILGAFMLVSWVASRAAHSAKSKGVQYLALFAFVVMEAVIFLPLLAYAAVQAPGAIESAATVTLLGFGLLTAIAFMTRKDFSFLRTVLFWGGAMAFVAIIASFIFGFQLGVWFSVAMIAFAGAAILYDTSNVLHHYPEDRYVGAALGLFASVALMFWYVLRLFISRD